MPLAIPSRVFAGLLLIALSVPSGVHAQFQEFEQCSTPNVVIDGLIEDTMTVTTDLALQDLRIGVVLDHANIMELYLTLSSPDGTDTLLFVPVSPFPTPGMNVDFCDFSTVSVADWNCGCELRVAQSLDLGPISTAGEWTLRVEDVIPGGGEGALQEWCVRASDGALPRDITGISSMVLPDGAARVRWNNNDAYDGIQVTVDGALYATLQGNANNVSVVGSPGEVLVCLEPFASGATFDSICVDATLRPAPPTMFVCFEDPPGTLQGTWVNSEDYEAVEVRVVLVNGPDFLVSVETLPGDATSFSSDMNGFPFAVISVAGVLNGVASRGGGCPIGPVFSTLPGVENLVCSPGVVPGTVEVTWSNPIAYTGIRVSDPTGVQPLLLGNATSYTTNPIAAANPLNVTVSVAPQTAAGSVRSDNCSVTVSGPDVPAPSLTCTPEPDGLVVVEWTGSYEFVEVWTETDWGRSPGLRETVAGTESATVIDTDLAALEGLIIKIRGVDASGAVSPFVEQAISIPGDVSGCVLIIDHDLEAFVPTVDSAGAVAETYQNLGLDVVTVTSAPIPRYVTGTPLLIWVAEGTPPHSFPVLPEEGERLVGYLAAGIPMVYERPGLFFGPSSLIDYDGADNLTASREEFVAVRGLSTVPGADFSSYQGAYMSEPDSTGEVDVPVADVLQPATDDLAGGTSVVIWESAGPGVPMGLFYDTDPPYGNVITTSFEFGGLDVDREAVALQYLELLVQPTNFLRGDVNGDGDLTPLVDAVALLNFGFASGTAPQCLAAADVDGNGAVIALLDAIYLLQFGFVAGAAAPPPPFPDCAEFQSFLGCEQRCP